MVKERIQRIFFTLDGNISAYIIYGNCSGKYAGKYYIHDFIKIVKGEEQRIRDDNSLVVARKTLNEYIKPQQIKGFVMTIYLYENTKLIWKDSKIKEEGNNVIIEI